jgi:hypothetical protein
VWAAVENVLRNPSVLAAELTRLRQGTQTQQTGLDHERHLLTAQVARGEKSLKRWEAAYVDEAIDLADFKAKKAEIDATRASLEQEIARLDAQQQFLEQAEIETTSLTAYCQRVQANLQRFDLPEKRLALTALSITATWHPEKPPEIRGIIPIEIASTAS